MTEWALVLVILLANGEQHSLKIGPLPGCNALISALPAKQLDAQLIVLQAQCRRKE